MSTDPRSYNRPARTTLTEDDIGQLGAAVLALTRELWVATDRLRILEAVLERRGIHVTAEIDAFQPDATLQAELDARGQELVGGIVNVLAGITD